MAGTKLKNTTSSILLHSHRATVELTLQEIQTWKFLVRLLDIISVSRVCMDFVFLNANRVNVFAGFKVTKKAIEVFVRDDIDCFESAALIVSACFD